MSDEDRILAYRQIHDAKLNEMLERALNPASRSQKKSVIWACVLIIPPFVLLNAVFLLWVIGLVSALRDGRHQRDGNFMVRCQTAGLTTRQCDFLRKDR